jgi:hypothetical protein
MRVEITNDNQNWLNWGKLVNLWIERSIPRPETVGELRQQLITHEVDATVQGKDERSVVIDDYVAEEDDPLVIMLPNRQMRDKRMTEDVQPNVPGPYPLPLFYDIVYGGAPRVALSSQEKIDFALRRIGEYTINECC